MRSIVLVGGFGTRLRPLTSTTPKPMLPVVHVAIIERLIANLVRGGVDDVTLALGFQPQPFIDAFPDGQCAGARLRYAVEDQPLDTAGAIRFAADVAGIDDTFVVANGDILTDLDVGAMVAQHRQRGARASLHVTPVDDPSAFGVVDLADDGRVLRFVEKPAPGTAPSNLINAGTYVLEAAALDTIDRGRRVSIERETFPALVADGGVYAHPTTDAWIDTGTPELYLRANLQILRTGERSGVHPHADVDASAVVDDSVVAATARVASGATVVRSVVLDGASIGPDATVTDSIVMGQVGQASTVTASVIGAAGRVDAGEVVDHIRRPSPDTP